VKGKKHSKKTVNLSFDEWNVWYHSNEQDKEITKRDKWGRALPLLEDIYNFEDALLTGSMLITLLRNADRVKIACLAQLVNVIAPIMTRNGGGCWAQATYWPFMQVSKYGRGTALNAIVDSPVYDCVDYEKVPLIDATATMGDDGSVTVFCVNRDMTEDFALDIDLHAFGNLRIAEHILLHHDDVKAVNTEEAPNNVAPTAGPGGVIDGEKATVKIPALSWNVIRFEKAE
jgi:alpha-N-arabinofuranosidase